MYIRLSRLSYKKYVANAERNISRNVKSFSTFVNNLRNNESYPASMLLHRTTARRGESVAGVCSEHFKPAFRPSSIIPPQADDCADCIPPLRITRKMLWDAIFDLDDNFNVGPDQIPPTFIKNCWSTRCSSCSTILSKPAVPLISGNCPMFCPFNTTDLYLF